MTFNILLISYNFPPVISPRSLRWIQFTRYLIKRGYKIDVLTIDPEMGYGIYDEGSIRMIPSGVNVYRTYPGPMHKLSDRYLPLTRGNLIGGKDQNRNVKDILREKMEKVYQETIKLVLIPDKMIEWLPWGLMTLKGLVRKKKYDLVISSAQPFTAHLLGYFSKKWTHTPWIGDYGDPWAFNPIFSRIKWRHSIDKWIESKLLETMDQVIVTTDETKKGFIKYYPFLEKEKITTISQGYDPKEFEIAQAELGNKFRIVYTGSFYDDIREPYTFFDAIERLKDIELEVIVAGSISSHHIKAAEEKGLKEKVIFLGRKSHKRAIALQKGADLLLFLSNSSPYQLPGKIFEYFAASRPILAIQFGEKDIAAPLIKKYNRGIVVSNDLEEIASTIRKIYELWRRKQLNKQFQLEPVKEHSWEFQAKKLENIIKNATSD